MEAWKWWDRSMHYLFSADPQAFLDGYAACIRGAQGITQKGVPYDLR